MYTRPPELSDRAVADALRREWAIAVNAIEYAAVGFGSHHWRVASSTGQWFVSVDDLSLPGRSGAAITGALTSAATLREFGLDFVVAPVPSTSGAVVAEVDSRFLAAVYAHVEGESSSFGRYESAADRREVIGHLAAIHGAPADLTRAAHPDDFAIPGRAELLTALGSAGERWTSGPYGDRASHLLERHGDAVRTALDHYDRLVKRTAGDGRSLVLTHGEPHRANTIRTGDGLVLIDWETARLAPRERDLWALVSEDAAVADHYFALTGHRIDRDLIAQYRLWWDLCEVSLYVGDFRRSHADTADSRVAWEGLVEHLDPSRWVGL